MLVGLFAELVVHFVVLLGGRSIGAGYNSAESDEQIVEPDRIIEHVLTAFCLGLDECLFDHRHLLIQGGTGVGNRFCVRVLLFVQALVESGHLRSDVADLANRVVHLCDFAENGLHQIELLLQIIRSHLQARVGEDLERLRLRFPVHGEADLVVAGQCQRTFGRTAPQG